MNLISVQKYISTQKRIKVITEKNVFGDGYRNWHKKSGLVEVSDCTLKSEKFVFRAFFSICFGSDTNIEIIEVICKQSIFPMGYPVGLLFKSYFCNKIMNT